MFVLSEYGMIFVTTFQIYSLSKENFCPHQSKNWNLTFFLLANFPWSKQMQATDRYLCIPPQVLDIATCYIDALESFSFENMEITQILPGQTNHSPIARVYHVHMVSLDLANWASNTPDQTSWRVCPSHPFLPWAQEATTEIFCRMFSGFIPQDSQGETFIVLILVPQQIVCWLSDCLICSEDSVRKGIPQMFTRAMVWWQNRPTGLAWLAVVKRPNKETWNIVGF